MAEAQNANVAKEQDLNQLLKVRREKLAALQENGKDPFQITKYDVTHHSMEVKNNFDTIEKATEFFNQQDDGELLSDPFLIRDMREASEAILSAVDEGRRICVYGDYDCDGITATAVLYSYLECMSGNVEYYINHRSEGYGLCSDAVRRLAESGVELIVTVDNGISAIEEAKLVAELM